MPNVKSAAKRVEVIRKRTIRNVRIKSALKTSIKNYEKAVKTNHADAGQQLRKAIVAIDKAVTKGVLHKNTAARKKSRLTRKLNKLTG